MASFSFWAYFVCVHLLLAALVICAARRGEGVSSLFRSSNGKHQYYYRQLLAFQQRIDEMLPVNSILFIGDSAIQGLDVTSIANQGVNFGIGGDTTAGVMARIGTYRSVESAKCVVLAVGYNDLKSSTNDEIVRNMERILQEIPRGPQVVCCGIVPTNERIRKERWNSRIADLNSSYARLCARREGTAFVDFSSRLADSMGNLRAEYSLDDGLHLNLAGRRMVANELRSVLADLTGH